MNPVFLSLGEVLEIHRDQIERYGGSMGIRDLGLLKSALATPAATFGGNFLHEDIFEMAAAFLFHIAKNHPFIDGNKRTAVVAAIVFLMLNGIEVDADEEDLERIVFETAKGKKDKSTIAAFFRINAITE